MANDREKPFEEILKDPRTRLAQEFILAVLEVRKKFNLQTKEVHVSPQNDFMCRFDTLCTLKVIQDYNVPKNEIVLY